MKIHERVTWILFSVILLLLYYLERQEVEKVHDWVQIQNQELINIDSLLNSVSKVADNNRISSGHQDWIFDSELRNLKEQGLSEPILQLKYDLTNRSDLIEYDGVLGGSMQIYSMNQIRILPGRFAFAIFEDGHVQGGLIVQYEVNDGEITWKIVESSLF